MGAAFTGLRTTGQQLDKQRRKNSTVHLSTSNKHLTLFGGRDYGKN